MDPWQLLKEVKNTKPNSLTAEVDVPEDSKWFEGHFPGEPILPGIALVNTVYQAIKLEAQIREEQVALCSLKRIRFTGPVRPGEKLIVSLTSEHSDQEIFYAFKVAIKETVVCSGTIAVARIKQDKKVLKEEGNA